MNCNSNSSRHGSLPYQGFGLFVIGQALYSTMGTVQLLFNRACAVPLDTAKSKENPEDHQHTYSQPASWTTSILPYQPNVISSPPSQPRMRCSLSRSSAHDVRLTRQVASYHQRQSEQCKVVQPPVRGMCSVGFGVPSADTTWPPAHRRSCVVSKTSLCDSWGERARAASWWANGLRIR